MLTKSTLLRTVSLPALALLLLAPASTQAANILPADGHVATGSASIGGNAVSTTVTQTTSRATINWNSFSVGAANSVTFTQPSANAATLNRVTGNTTSTIAGSISATGQVFLINPNGIAITPSGAVNTGGGFVASTLALTDSDFNAGKLNFKGTGASKSVANQGSITAGTPNTGGFIALIGGAASNSGTISAPLGKVALGSGEQATLNLTGDNFLQIAIPSAQPDTTTPLIANQGQITANGGRIELKAATAKAIIRQAINIPGKLQASTISAHDGAIVLDGGDGGVVNLNGDTSGTALNAPAITASGYDIAITAPIDAPNTTLTLAAAHTITDTAALKVKKFALNKGAWTQNTTTLPAFAATDFGLDPANATFLRVQAGNGLLASPYRITDSYGLQGMESYSLLSKNFVLANNIDAAGSANWNNGLGFNPIGNQSRKFTGSLNGYNRSIDNLTINRPLEDNVGLFGEATGSFSNLHLTDGSITGYSNVGALIGGQDDGSITSVKSSANVYSNKYAGGIAGYIYGTISDSYASGNVVGTFDVGGLIGKAFFHAYVVRSSTFADVLGQTGVGGLIGENAAGIAFSYAKGTVISKGDDAGGLVGSNTGVISNSYATGDVKGGNITGGLVGECQNFYGGGIFNSYASGNVAGQNDVGGLIGLNAFGTIKLSQAFGTVQGKYIVGGLIGLNQGSSLTGQGSVDNSYANGAVSGTQTIGGLVGMSMEAQGAPIKTGLHTLINNSFATGSITGILSPAQDSMAGGLVGENQGTIANSWAYGTVSGGSILGGFVGYNFGGAITNSVSYSAVKSSGNNVGGFVGYNGKFDTVASILNSKSFGDVDARQGTSVGGFAGNNERANQIIGVIASGNVIGGAEIGGLVGTNGGEIKNSIAKGNVHGAFVYVGGLVGLNFDSITYSYAEGNVSGYEVIGGFVGENSFGNITNSTAFGKTTGDHVVGGFAGDNYGNSTLGTGTIKNAVANGNVDAASAAGGFVGVNYDDKPGQTAGISGSYATGIVTNTHGALSYAGGFVGENFGTIDTSSAYGDVGKNSAPGYNELSLGGFVGTNKGGTISNSFAAGDVKVSNGDYIGGFVGVNEGPYGAGISTIKSSFAFGDVSGSSFVGGFAGSNTLATTLITDSMSSGMVTGSPSVAGGFIGSNAGTIVRSGATNTVTGDTLIGGFVGTNDGTIDASYAAGDVTGIDKTGGFAGANAGLITHSDAYGDVSGNTETGGFIGHNSANLTNVTAAGDVINFAVSGGAPASSYLISDIGGLAGYNEGAIANSHATGDVTISFTDANQAQNVGGFVGTNASEGEITNSFAKGNVRSTGMNIGGFAGNNSGTITQGDYATGNVSSALPDQNVGGFVGFNTGTIDNAYATGKVGQQGTFPIFKPSTDIGGFVGNNQAGSISNGAAFGDVEGDRYVGGFAGINSDATSMITDSIASGSVTGTDAFATGNVFSVTISGRIVGGFVGENSGTVETSYSTGDVIGLTGVGGFVGNNNGPIMHSNAYGNVHGDEGVGGFAGFNYADITDDTAAGKVANFSTDVLGGFFYHSYYGGLVGDNIGNINSSHATGDIILTFVEPSDGRFQDAPFGQFVGGLVGSNDGKITNSFAKGDVSTKGIKIGGFVGENNGSITEGNYETGNVLTTYINLGIGGFAGSNAGAIDDAHATGNVGERVVGQNNFTGEDVGGFVGENITGLISNSTASGNVTGGTNVGGFAGRNRKYSSTDSGEITNSSEHGKVTGVNYVGGFVATNAGTITNSTAYGTATGDTSVGPFYAENTGTIE